MRNSSLEKSCFCVSCWQWNDFSVLPYKLCKKIVHRLRAQIMCWKTVVHV